MVSADGLRLGAGVLRNAGDGGSEGAPCTRRLAPRYVLVIRAAYARAGQEDDVFRSVCSLGEGVQSC